MQLNEPLPTNRTLEHRPPRPHVVSAHAPATAGSSATDVHHSRRCQPCSAGMSVERGPSPGSLTLEPVVGIRACTSSVVGRTSRVRHEPFHELGRRARSIDASSQPSTRVAADMCETSTYRGVRYACGAAPRGEVEGADAPGAGPRVDVEPGAGSTLNRSGVVTVPVAAHAEGRYAVAERTRYR